MASQDVCSNFVSLGKIAGPMLALSKSVGLSNEKSNAIKTAFASAAPWQNYPRCHSLVMLRLVRAPLSF